MNTGEKIRGVRLLKGFSQENMADMLKISRNAYSEIERSITDISESRLKQIADVLEVSPNDIHNFEDKRSLFFENCSGAVGINNTQTINLENKDLHHKIEVLELKLQNQALEIDKINAEKEKAQLEAKYWRETAEK